MFPEINILSVNLSHVSACLIYISMQMCIYGISTSRFRLQMIANSLRSLVVIQMCSSRLCRYLATRAMVNHTHSTTRSSVARKSSQPPRSKHHAQWGFGQPLTLSEMPSSSTVKDSLGCRPIRTSEHDCC